MRNIYQNNGFCFAINFALGNECDSNYSGTGISRTTAAVFCYLSTMIFWCRSMNICLIFTGPPIQESWEPLD